MKYEDVRRPEMMKGLKFWTNEKNEFDILMIHYTADPDKDPERGGERWYKEERKSNPLDTWNKEYEIDFTTKQGKLIFGGEFCDFSEDIHFIPSRKVEGEKLLGLDFGQSNPNAALVAIYDKMGRIFIVDEYFKPNIPSAASEGMFRKFAHHFIDPEKLLPYTEEDFMKLSIADRRDAAYDAFQIRVIDPTTRHKNRVGKAGEEEIPYSVIEEFFDNGWDFEPGINDVDAGITKIREYLKVDDNGKSNLYIFSDKCPHLCEELLKYKYKELGETQERQHNQPEVPVKKDDHAVDALRYIMMTRPNKPVIAKKELTRVQRDVQSFTKPKVFDDSWDIDE